MKQHKLVDIGAQLIEIGLYASFAATAYQALAAPREHVLFLAQSLEFLIVAELLVIHSIGMFSAGARKKFGINAALALFVFYATFMTVVTVIFSQWLLGAFMIATLVVRALRSYFYPQDAGIGLPIRIVVFLFAAFTAPIAISIIGGIIPDLVATSDPAYMAIMGKSGFVVWVIEYYALVALLSLLALLWSLWPQTTKSR